MAGSRWPTLGQPPPSTSSDSAARACRQARSLSAACPCTSPRMRPPSPSRTITNTEAAQPSSGNAMASDNSPVSYGNHPPKYSLAEARLNGPDGWTSNSILCLPGQPQRRVEQHVGAVDTIGPLAELARRVADAGARGDEDHAGLGERRQVLPIVPGAGDQLLPAQPQLIGGRGQRRLGPGAPRRPRAA